MEEGKIDLSLLKEDFPQEALSPDNSRGFELTSIKAAYVIERLNDVFGVFGWRYELDEFVEYSGELTVRVTLVVGEHRIPNIGGGKIIKNRVADAQKSAITDGITKCASFLGIGHTVFKGLAVGAKGKPGKQPDKKPGATGKKAPPPDTKVDISNVKCPKCGAAMVEKQKRDGTKFLGCSKYHETGCKGSMDMPKPAPSGCVTHRNDVPSDMKKLSDKNMAELDCPWETIEEACAEIEKCNNNVHLKNWWDKHYKALQKHFGNDFLVIVDIKEQRKAKLSGPVTEPEIPF